MSTILYLPEMHCNNCVERIANALTAADLDFQVSLDDKTVTIEGDDQAVNTAIQELDDLGFYAERQ